MKCLTLIIHEAAKHDIIERLRDEESVRGFTILSGEGHSRRTQRNPFETNHDRVMGYVPRVRVDVVLEAKAVEPLLGKLKDCDSCVTGLGVWWVTPVEASGYL